MVHRAAFRPRQPQRQCPNSSTPKMSQDSVLNTVLCHRCWASMSSTKSSPVSNVALSSAKPTAMVRNSSDSSSVSGGSARSQWW